ncbi:DUF4388 domain-containing protein [Allocoleopsis sp.]|uniref:DUF4388 domain-containing protein n=1 Tax=Allocoleopsis sp. TaxID=3088169 RepID=UPI002FD739E8
MSITGHLSDFSLPEIFQLLEKGHKTGLLTLHPELSAQEKPQSHYIWVYQGRIVAASNRLDQQGLVSLIDQRQWVSDRVFDKLVHWCCPINEPLGLYLKNQGVLQAKQLKRLFQFQVLSGVCALLQFKEAEFKFEPNVPIPTREMTGFSVLATEAVLAGLRVLQNWDALVDQLPDPNGGLVSIIAGQPTYRLDTLEWQVWEYTKGTMSLGAIARQLRLPVEKVQQVAFRLITIGLAEEVPLLVGTLPTQEVEPLPAQVLEDEEKQNVSPSFVQSLVGFLRSKVVTQPTLSNC